MHGQVAATGADRWPRRETALLRACWACGPLPQPARIPNRCASIPAIHLHGAHLSEAAATAHRLPHTHRTPSSACAAHLHSGGYLLRRLGGAAAKVHHVLAGIGEQLLAKPLEVAAVQTSGAMNRGWGQGTVAVIELLESIIGVKELCGKRGLHSRSHRSTWGFTGAPRLPRAPNHTHPAHRSMSASVPPCSSLSSKSLHIDEGQTMQLRLRMPSLVGSTGRGEQVCKAALSKCLQACAPSRSPCQQAALHRRKLPLVCRAARHPAQSG